jgi:hypothetical protein
MLHEMVWSLGILPESLGVCATLPRYWCYLPCD